MNMPQLLGPPIPDGKMYSATLPGTLMPWMFMIPQSWMTQGQVSAARYTLAESFKPNRDDKEHTFWDHAYELTLAKHEKPLIPPTPGFWNKMHGYARYVSARRGDVLDYDHWRVAGRPTS